VFQCPYNNGIGFVRTNWHSLTNHDAVEPIQDIMAITYAYRTVQILTLQRRDCAEVFTGNPSLLN
jgi:hypothetical protein